MRNKIINNSLFWSFFLSLSGYYVVLILVTNIFSNELSRYFTIPIRLLIVILLFVVYRFKNKNSRNKLVSSFFYLFSVFYLLRIFIEVTKGSELYMSHNSFLLYFLSFVLIPYFLLSQTSLIDQDYKRIFYSVLIGSLGVSILTFYYYGDLIGQVERISHEIGKNENYISPLALSYCSVLGMGVIISYLLTNKVSLKKLMLLLVTNLIFLIPFFLGASRGSVFAILVPFLLYFLFSKKIKNKIKTFLLGFLFIGFVIYSTAYFGSGVFDRFLGISESIQTGSSSAVRLLIWKADINQFFQNPIMGNSLQSELVKHYSHNILIESLITTGLLGSIPFFIFLFVVFKKAIFIIRYHPQYFWLVNIFIIGFIQNMFSGAIWGMNWTILGAALIIGLNPETQKKRK